MLYQLYYPLGSSHALFSSLWLLSTLYEGRPCVSPSQLLISLKSQGTHIECAVYPRWLKADFVGFPWLVQWLALCASTARGAHSIPGRGTKILHATWSTQGKKKLIL